MKLTYGNGEVLIDGQVQAFDIRFKGAINIINPQDNWVIGSGDNKIMGVNMNQSNEALLFEYEGKLKILAANYVKDDSLHNMRIEVQGMGYWELDREKWEDDGSLWGTKDGTYVVGGIPKKTKSVYKSLKTIDDRYYYKDGTPVGIGIDIHIHNTGVVMTGPEHNADSVRIYEKDGLKRVKTVVAMAKHMGKKIKATRGEY